MSPQALILTPQKRKSILKVLFISLLLDLVYLSKALLHAPLVLTDF